jgi:hypothetical protein
MVDTDLFGKGWNTLYKVISGAVPDPIDRGSKWIWAANPQIGSETKPNLRYPIMVIEPLTINSQSPQSFGTKLMDTDIGTTIEVHDNEGGSRFDAVCSDLQAAVWNNTSVLAQSGLLMPEFTGGTYDHIYFSRDNRLHIKSFGLGFTSTD